MTRTISRRRVLQGLGMLGLGGVTRAAGAQDPVNPPPSSPALPPLPGTVGLLRGQFARLAVVNHDHGNLAGAVDPELIVAEIIGADGQVLASAQFSQLRPNEARFLDFVHPEKKGKPGDARIELFARVRALLRRNAPPDDGAVVVGSLRIDPAARRVTRSGEELTLTKTEYELLLLLAEHAGQVLTRDTILERVWGYDFETTSNSLDVYIGYLRRKTEEGGRPRMIHTVRGVGHVLRSDET